MDVVSVAGARSLKVGSDGAGSSPRSAKWKLEPRRVALSASIEHVLISAGLKASEQLKRTWPKFSAATYARLANVIPSLLGMLAFAAAFTTYGTIVLSVIVALPAAFRLFVVAQSRQISKVARGRLTILRTLDKELPIYSIIVPLRDEARMVDQLLSAIEALDYPGDKLDVIIAVEADCHDTRAAITAR
jgi:glycosyltransferase XagB